MKTGIDTTTDMHMRIMELERELAAVTKERDALRSYALFGRLMWDMIQQIGGSFCGDEWSEDVLPLAQQAGLCHRAMYDPEIHWDYDIECAEPGDEIWVFGEEVRGE